MDNDGILYPPWNTPDSQMPPSSILFETSEHAEKLLTFSPDTFQTLVDFSDTGLGYVDTQSTSFTTGQCTSIQATVQESYGTKRIRQADDYDLNPPKKNCTRKTALDSSTDGDRRRFACPYQALESWRDCFKPSPKNPKGGCESLQRLR